MSSHTTVKAANWRFVELGRVVLINNKELATIVEIIDQKRVCIQNREEEARTNTRSTKGYEEEYTLTMGMKGGYLGSVGPK